MEWTGCGGWRPGEDRAKGPGPTAAGDPDGKTRARKRSGKVSDEENERPPRQCGQLARAAGNRTGCICLAREGRGERGG